MHDHTSTKSLSEMSVEEFHATLVAGAARIREEDAVRLRKRMVAKLAEEKRERFRQGILRW